VEGMRNYAAIAYLILQYLSSTYVKGLRKTMEDQVSSYITNTPTTHSMTKCVCQCLPKNRLGILDQHRNEKRHAMFLPVFFTFFSENIMTQDSVGKE
jgi:hypothetical protein